MLSSVLALSPIWATLLQLLAGLYGIYVLYLGLPVLMQSPREKAFGYTASVVICTILVGIVFAVLSTVAHIGGARQGFFGAAGATAAEQAADRAAAAPGAGAPAADAAQNSPSSLSAAGGLLTALGGALGGPHRVDTVDFNTLRAMLPASLPGMMRTRAEGESQGAVGVKTSSAKADYAGNNGAGVHIEIADISGVSGLVDLAGGLIQSTTSESDSGFERNVLIGGRTVHEKYDARNRHGDLSIILVKRFSVEVSGNDVNMDSLEQTLSQIDLARLESMKDAGAQAK
jgi:hypothetical protein